MVLATEYEAMKLYAKSSGYGTNISIIVCLTDLVVIEQTSILDMLR